MGQHVLVSVPETKVETAPDALPPRIGLRVIDAEGKRVGDMAACTDLHGEATSARLVAFCCKEGVLIARPGGIDGPLLLFGKMRSCKHVARVLEMCSRMQNVGYDGWSHGQFEGKMRWQGPV